VRFGEHRATGRPPIPLPGQPNVVFLDTVGAVTREGERMHHCIASYIPRAVAGNCFLFHVDYAGEQASVEVNPWGQVTQAFGPSNKRNVAAQWGRRVLGSWGRKLATSPRSRDPAAGPDTLSEHANQDDPHGEAA
jgi:PcfJ-like protein